MKGMLGGRRRIHVVGIGGAGMSAMAEVLAAWGAVVSGSDEKHSAAVDRLRGLGVRVEVGHRPENVTGAEVVVRSRAVRDSNPEVVAARAAGVPVWSRTEALAAMVATTRGVAVSGTHGKTSTSAMLAAVLAAAGMDPSYIVGGDVAGTGSGGHAGGGPLMVVEADESDGTFLALPCEAGLATNVEPDHLDHFGDVERLRADFASFVAGLPGPRVVCGDDPFLASLPGTIRYGTSQGAAYRLSAWRPEGGGSAVTITAPSGDVSFRLRLPGRHFALNATGAAALACELGAPLEAVGTALSGFRGVARRFEHRGEAAGVRVVDDYAHLPSEVAATIAAARPFGRRVVAVFQPHRFSRTEALWRDFGPSFAGADPVVVCDVFGAGEDPLPGVSGRLVADAVASSVPGTSVVYVADRACVARRVAALVHPGDVVLTMGAGDITRLADELLPLLEDR